MHSLYPAIKPYAQHELKVTSPHVLYVEETGNPDGIPVIVLHLGPGTGSDPHLRRFFDPQLYRIVLFDQRGCGRSTPHLDIQNNTTDMLLEDIDTIRDYLGITDFVLLVVVGVRYWHCYMLKNFHNKLKPFCYTHCFWVEKVKWTGFTNKAQVWYILITGVSLSAWFPRIN